MILNVSVLCAILFKSSLAEKYWKAMIVLVPLFFFKMGQPRPLFHLFSSFQTHITIFTTNKCEKMSIQYTVLGFEPTTFGT